MRKGERPTEPELVLRLRSLLSEQHKIYGGCWSECRHHDDPNVPGGYFVANGGGEPTWWMAVPERPAGGKPMTCLKCGLPPDDLFHHPEGLGGTGTWGAHVFVGEAEKRLLQFALREMSMVMKAGQKGSRLTPEQARWNAVI